LHATKAAIESGFLPGGGIALAKAGLQLLDSTSTEETLLANTVSKIVADSCMSPLKRILKNGDKSVDYIVEMLKKNKDDWNYGYDVRTEEYVDMIECGIIDPEKVTETALKNAVSVSNSLLSVGCVVLNNQYSDNGVQLVQLSDDMY
jgi:chaperonin GroEL